MESDKIYGEFMEYTKSHTLVKYNPPGSVHKWSEKGHLKSQKAKQCDVKVKVEKAVDDALTLIFPPKVIEKPNKAYSLTISPLPATKSDVIALGENFDKLLFKYKAKHAGICHIRSTLFSQLFDEIIRQTTIDCSAQGLLLSKIRNEIQSTISSFEKLYESSAGFYIRKSLLLENELLSLKQNEASLLSKIPDLKSQVEEIQTKIKSRERQSTLRIRKLKASHKAEVLKLRREMEDGKKNIWNKLFPKEEYVPDERWV